MLDSLWYIWIVELIFCLLYCYSLDVNRQEKNNIYIYIYIYILKIEF